MTLRIALFILCIASAAKAHADDPVPLVKNVDREPSVCVILIGGIDSDPTPQQIEGLRMSALHYVENARRFKRDLQPQLTVYP